MLLNFLLLTSSNGRLVFCDCGDYNTMFTCSYQYFGLVFVFL